MNSIGASEASTSGTVGAWDQRPYRQPVIGSGIQCPGAEGGIECESPLTTRLRGGMDTLQRPIGEYICETCGTVFTAVTISLDPALVRFDDVDAQGAEEGARIEGIAGALRRGERTVKARRQARKFSVLTCPDCKDLFDDSSHLDRHVRSRHWVAT